MDGANACFPGPWMAENAWPERRTHLGLGRGAEALRVPRKALRGGGRVPRQHLGGSCRAVLCLKRDLEKHGEHVENTTDVE